MSRIRGMRQHRNRASWLEKPLRMSGIKTTMWKIAGPVCLALAITACGGGDEDKDDRLSDDAYFKGLAELAEESRQAEFFPGDDASRTVAIFADTVGQIYGNYIEGLKALSPPADAKDEHADVVVAFEEFLAALDQIAGEIGRGENYLSHSEALREAVANESRSISEALCALQDIANEKQIAREVGCDRDGSDR